MRTIILLSVVLSAVAVLSVSAMSLPALHQATLQATADSTHALDGIHPHFIPLTHQHRTETEEEEYFDKLEEHHDLLHEGESIHKFHSMAQ